MPNLIFEDWENFARYGFNKSHAADYGVIAVQTAYLKTHYTVEYMTALLSASKNETEKVAEYVADCRSMGIDVLPPDINFSQWDFSVEDRAEAKPAIRFGLGAVKNVGLGPVEMILAGRKNDRFQDLTSLSQRVDLRGVGKRALECLVKVGALDNFGPRAAIFQSLDRLVNASGAHFRAIESGQMSFFGIDQGVSEEIHLPSVKDPDRKELLAWEKELIGLYVSAHPLTPYLPLLKGKVSHHSGQLKDVSGKDKVKVAGMVTRFRPHQTKDGNPMGFVTIEDLQGEMDLVVFPRAWEKCGKLVHVDEILIVEGKVDNDGATPKILVDRMTCFSPEDAQKQDVKELKPDVIVETKAIQANSPRSPVVLTENKNTREKNWDDETMDPFPPDMDMELSSSDLLNESLLWQDHEFESSKDINQNSAPITAITLEDPALYPAEAIVMDVTPTIMQPIRLTPIASSEDGLERKRLLVYIRSSGNMERDIRKMKNIQGTLLSFPGKDFFAFQIFEHGKGFLIEFPNHTTKVCHELLDRLGHIVGQDEFVVETVTIQ